jgi:hypothetical protein
MKIKTILQVSADIIFGIASIAAMLLALFVLIVVSATPAQAYTQEERAQASLSWNAEHGDLQPNLTEPARQEALVFTATKQKELDNEKGKSKN